MMPQENQLNHFFQEYGDNVGYHSLGVLKNININTETAAQDIVKVMQELSS